MPMRRRVESSRRAQPASRLMQVALRERERARWPGLMGAGRPEVIRKRAPGLMREPQQESRSMQAMLSKLGLSPARLETMRGAPSRLS